VSVRGSIALASLAVAALLTGCILVVSPSDHGEHCRFEGEGSACGACLRDRCEALVDRCCGEGCSALGALDRCARGEGGACEALAVASAGSAAEASATRDLAACVTERCAAVCRTFAGTSETRCQEPAFGRGETCACATPSEAAGANDFECSPAAYPGTVCCAPSSWPAAGQECTCLPFSCTSTPDGCACGLSESPPTSESRSCRARHCCARADTCVCRDKACFDLEEEVDGCQVPAPENLGGCKAGQRRVESCSIRRP